SGCFGRFGSRRRFKVRGIKQARRETMSEKNARGVTMEKKLYSILFRLSDLEAKMDSVDTQMQSLNAKVGKRLHDRRLVWEVISARTEKMVEQFGQMTETFRLNARRTSSLNKQVSRVRAEYRLVESQVALFEQIPSGRGD